MCGITGFWQASGCLENQAIQTIRRMTDTLAHRGPDDSGEWLDCEAGIVLGHRRLAILDLSPAGHQPMVSHSGRYVIVFNGEIYNHLELRSMLESHAGRIAWRGHCDTETLLTCIETWGIETTLKRCVGMFALAVWDCTMRTLTLARDRLGEKPLYYGWQEGIFLFASELKALRIHPAFKGKIDREALALYFRHGYIPAPLSIYKGVYKLIPGTYLTIRYEEALRAEMPTPVSYWSLVQVAESGQKNPFAGSEEEAIDELERLITQAVNLQKVADVPVGVFLSGGIDSSTVTALMQAQSSQPIRTFTIGFHEDRYNEAPYAKKVAQHLGTNHIELYVTPVQAMEVIPRLPQVYDEPFSDSSQIPTFLVTQLARQQVVVCLSGDGGDELFGGYTRYRDTYSAWQTLRWLPSRARSPAGGLIGVLGRFLGECTSNSMLPRALRKAVTLSHRTNILAEALRTQSLEGFYQALNAHWRRFHRLVVGICPPPYKQTGFHLNDFYHRMMLVDATTYLPDDILVKVDRAAMGVSLETRIPVLDHRVVEFAWSLPLHHKIREGQTKWILRQLLYRYVPSELLEHPKMGFAVPIDRWLRGPLRDWAECLLDEKRLTKAGYIDPRPVRRMWEQHLAGTMDWQYYLWDVLMWEAWRESVDV